MEKHRNAEPARHFAFGRPSDREHLGELSPRRDAVQARSRETVDVILEAAAQVFVRDGFGATTTERIAERAGVSVGSLYQYWSSKEAIAVALMERHGEAHILRLIPALQRLRDAAIPLEVRVEDLMRALVDGHGNPDLHWILETDVGVPRVYRDRIGELSAGLAGYLETALGLTPDSALVVTCALDALPHALLRPSTRLRPEALVRELTHLVVAYVSTSRAASGESSGR